MLAITKLKAVIKFGLVLMQVVRWSDAEKWVQPTGETRAKNEIN